MAHQSDDVDMRDVDDEDAFSARSKRQRDDGDQEPSAAKRRTAPSSFVLAFHPKREAVAVDQPAAITEPGFLRLEPKTRMQIFEYLLHTEVPLSPVPNHQFDWYRERDLFFDIAALLINRQLNREATRVFWENVVRNSDSDAEFLESVDGMILANGRCLDLHLPTRLIGQAMEILKGRTDLWTLEITMPGNSWWSNEAAFRYFLRTMNGIQVDHNVQLHLVERPDLFRRRDVLERYQAAMAELGEVAEGMKEKFRQSVQKKAAKEKPAQGKPATREEAGLICLILGWLILVVAAKEKAAKDKTAEGVSDVENNGIL